jgi:GT2 family glycosyltransferase
MDTPSVSALAEKVTVVMVPRERLTTAPRALASLIATIPAGVPLIVVDGAYPSQTRQHIDELATQRPFVSLRFDHYLLPPEARNRGLKLVKTPYVVFVDNDVEFEKGWLENMFQAAETKDVAAVSVLTTIRVPRNGQAKEFVHHAGGTIRYVVHRLQLTYASIRRNEWGAPDDPSIGKLSRLSDDIEFHAFIIRADLLRAVGGFDERLSVCDHDDLSLRLQAMGRRIAFCPDAKVCYDATGSIDGVDLGYFSFRWSRANIALSCRAFRQNWRVSQYFAWEWAMRHRKIVLASFSPALFRRLPLVFFDLYFGWLRLKHRRHPGERNRRALGPRHACPPVPKAVAQFYRERLKERDPDSEFPQIPADLAYPPPSRGGVMQPAE